MPYIKHELREIAKLSAESRRAWERVEQTESKTPEGFVARVEEAVRKIGNNLRSFLP